MEYTEEIDHKKRIIIVRTKGDLKTKELSPISASYRLKAKRLSYKLLFDFRKSKNFISIIDAHRWAIDQLDKIDPELVSIKTAHISNSVDREFFKFVETSWYNNGMNVKHFDEERAAIKWLESL